jgi:hypothetical protein
VSFQRLGIVGAAFLAAVAALALVGSRLGGSGKSGGLAESPATGASPESGAPEGAPGPTTLLRHPPVPVAELGVLTERDEASLAEVVDRATLSALIEPRHCGDPVACEAVRAAVGDDRSTILRVVAASDWDLDRLDLDASAASLSPAARSTLRKRGRVVVVRVTTTASGRSLAVRAAFAAAAAIAEKIDGLVYDQLLGRIEGAKTFAAHAVLAPLADSAFRADRIQLLYEPKRQGVVRVLTAGLSRWGAPDIEAVAVPTAATPRVAEVVLATASALASGALAGPVVLSRADLERARGKPYPADPGLPADALVSIDLTSVPPEPGDPNDFMARIVPAEGDGPVGYLALAERFFGEFRAASPDESVLHARTERARRELPAALARWASSHQRGGRLLVQLPFAIPGDAGVESMWVEVSRFDDQTVTGKLLDEPLGATDIARGDTITRPRSIVEDFEERGPSDE